MNRIVREKYPAAKLPDDLRGSLDEANDVRVTIEVLPAGGIQPSPFDAGTPVPKPGLFSAYRHLAKGRFTSLEEINDHVLALREEWDHRDR